MQSFTRLTTPTTPSRRTNRQPSRLAKASTRLCSLLNCRRRQISRQWQASHLQMVLGSTGILTDLLVQGASLARKRWAHDGTCHHKCNWVVSLEKTRESRKTWSSSTSSLARHIVEKASSPQREQAPLLMESQRSSFSASIRTPTSNPLEATWVLQEETGTERARCLLKQWTPWLAR